MNRICASLLLAFALGLPLCAFGVDPGTWLTPACTEADPYMFASQEDGDVFSFPTDTYKEWTVFNASSAAAEGATTYTIALKDNEKYLAFAGSSALAQDSSAYLALGIRNNAGGGPLVMAPAPGAKMRTDNVYAKVLFVPTSDKPDPETLKEMYPSYEDRKLAGTDMVSPTAAKLGVFVDESGYFCVSRARFSSDEDAGDSGTAEDYVYEFVQTDHTLEDLGNGAVIIRIEFQTYSDATNLYTRMFRIFAQDAAKTKAEVCLTKGLGCQWATEELPGTDAIEYSYKYDFSKAGDYLPAWDTAVVLENDENISVNSLAEIDELNLLGFSATSGGFYSAWLAINANVTSAAVLQSYVAANMSLAGFEPYVTDPNNSAFSIYTDWATRYNVNLESYLGQLPGTQTMSLMASSEAKDIEYVYNAFLLDMDPAVDVTQSLMVTGLSPDAEQIAMTVCGPAGAKLANLKAAKLCVKRSETPDGLNADDVYTVYPNFTADAQGNIIFLLPTKVADRILPFMKVTLEPLYPAE